MSLYLLKNKSKIASITAPKKGDWVQIGTKVGSLSRLEWNGKEWVDTDKSESLVSKDFDPAAVTSAGVVKCKCPYNIVDPAFAWPSEFQVTLRGYAESLTGERISMNGLPSDAIVIP